MAELNILIPYRTQATRLAFWSGMLCFPIWSLITPVLLGLFIDIVIAYPHLNPFLVGIICTSSILLILLGMGISAVVEDNRLRVSKNGISLPPMLTVKTNFRRDFRWTELRSAFLSGKNNRTIALTFLNAPALSFNLGGMKTSDQEQLFLALELWGKSCERSPELIELQQGLQKSEKEKGQQGYTQMWEEELGRRFSSTTFIPLEPEQTLQNRRFKIVRQLAFGGFSAVYLAQESGLDLVVLKEAVIPANADEATRETAEAHLKRESEMLCKIQHPNIAYVKDFFVEENRYYLVLEYISGQDLRQLAKQKGVQNQKDMARLGVQMASILKFLHELSPPIVHRDFTPDNLVLKNDGELILIDFGASNEFIGTATGTMIGKQAYIAPEQLRGKTRTVSDLYALGGTLAFLLTGKDPVPLKSAQLHADNPEIDEELSDLITALTQFDHKSRPQSAGEVLDKLTAISARLNSI